MIKQSSVEWLQEQIVDVVEDYYDGIINLHQYIKYMNKAIEQAKSQHKDEMKHFFNRGMHLVEGHLYKPSHKFEEHYNETFGGDNENNEGVLGSL